MSCSRLCVVLIHLTLGAPGAPIAVAHPPAAASVVTSPPIEGRRQLSIVTTRPTLAGGRYVPPVDAPIVDHFRPPACRWCPGNRGIDYATVPGGPVGASAGGVVTFAGQVGGQLFVVIAHPDGLRTTYAFVATISVQVGQRVVRGDIVATSADRLHFGVRRGDIYLDPELLFGGAVARARLVPTDGSRARPAGWASAPALR
jgi:murein DD-endopeptidase MepM/ murein hydrolase activator NlpD